MSLRSGAVAGALAIALFARLPSADAGWSRGGTAGSAELLSVSSPDGRHVAVAGFVFDGNNFFAPVLPRAHLSTDGARSFKEVTSTAMGTGGMATPRAVFFVDASTGFVTVGKKVFATADGGKNWSVAQASDEPHALHFFDASRGILAGAGGRILSTADGARTFTAVTSPTTTTLRHQFWLDARRGWISGWNEDDEGRPSGAVLLATTDGGASWSVVFQVADRGLGPIFFLPDGRTGWVAGFTWVDADKRDAQLYKTTDGATFSDAALPIEVGKLKVFGFTGPVNTTYLRAMYWEDARRGHLSGTAFLIKTSSGGSGGGSSDKRFWKLVDYVTDDGGASWRKTDVGTIAFDMQSPPADDGLVMDGYLRDLHNGVLAGSNGATWIHQTTCSSAAECGAGYGCDDGRCARAQAPACSPACGAGKTCVDGTCVGEGDGDGGEEETDGGLRDAGTRRPRESADAGGCDCTTTPGAMAGLLVLLGGTLVRRRSSRTLGR